MAKVEKSFVFKAAFLLMIVQVLSRVLGYARDVVLMNMFGQSYMTDAFNVAFTIPDFIYNVLIGGAIASAFIPVFSSYLATDQPDKAWRTSSIFSTWSLTIMVVLVALAFVFTYPLLGLLTSYDHEAMRLPVILTRITLIQALFMALSAIATGILQSYQHFTWPAIGTLLYNAFILLFGIVLVKPIENIWPGYGIAGFSVGVVIGALATLVVQIPTLIKVGFNYKPCFDTKDEGLRKMVRLLIPVLIGLSVSQINVLVTQYLATGLDDGIYTALRTANRFMQLPLGLFAVSICTAIFPTMTAQAAQGEYEELKKSMSLALRTSLFIILPAAVGMIVLREPIIRLLFEFSGRFTSYDTFICGQALFWYCLGLPGYSATFSLIRVFYALQDTKTPIIVSVIAIVLNAVLSFILVHPLQHIGLALAYSISGWSQCALLAWALRRRLGDLHGRHILLSLGRTLIGAVAMGAVVWGVAKLCSSTLGVADKMSQLLQVGGSIAVGVLVFAALAWLMKMEEIHIVLDIFGRRLRRRRLKQKYPAAGEQAAEEVTAEEAATPAEQVTAEAEAAAEEAEAAAEDAEDAPDATTEAEPDPAEISAEEKE